MDNQPIRVAHVIGKMLAGGVESVVFNYYRQMDKTKVQFDIYYDADSTVLPPQDLLDMGANFIKIPPYQSLFAYLKALKKHFKENNYTIVHSHMNTLSVFALFAAKCAGVPVRIAHNHSVPGKGEFIKNVLKYTLRMGCKWFSTDYFACGEKAGRWMFSDKTFDSGKVKVINNAIDFERFSKDENITQSLKAQLNLEGKLVVGNVGRLTYQKNHDFLIDIFCEIAKLRPESVLLLVGDGELRKELENKVASLELSDKVIFVGKTPTPEHYYPLMDVFVMPSHFEGLPVTSIEAQVNGVASLFADTITKELVISDACLFLSLEDSAKKWAECAIELSEKEQSLTDNSNKFNIKHTAPDLQNWYINKTNEITKR